MRLIWFPTTHKRVLRVFWAFAKYEEEKTHFSLLSSEHTLFHSRGKALTEKPEGSLTHLIFKERGNRTQKRLPQANSSREQWVRVEGCRGRWYFLGDISCSAQATKLLLSMNSRTTNPISWASISTQPTRKEKTFQKQKQKKIPSEKSPTITCARFIVCANPVSSSRRKAHTTQLERVSLKSESRRGLGFLHNNSNKKK